MSDRATPLRLAICNQKGGVGKTTTAVSLAATLSRRGYCTLLIDVDPQGNASTGLGISPVSRLFTTYDLVTRGPTVEQAAILCLPNLSAIPASQDLAGAELELANNTERERCLSNSLGDWLAGRDHHDVIILDCPPSLGLLTVNALVAADVVLVPLQCEFFALEGLAHLLTTLDRIRARLNPRLGLEGVLLTMFDRRNNLSELVANDVRSFLGDKVFDTVIPRNVRISEAPSHGQPITVYDPKSPGALAYGRLAEEFLSHHPLLRPRQP